MGIASTKCSAVELPPISLQYRVIIKASGAADESQRLEALRAQKAMRNDLNFMAAPDFRRPTTKDSAAKSKSDIALIGQ